MLLPILRLSVAAVTLASSLLTLSAAATLTTASRRGDALVGYFYLHFYDSYAGPGDYTTYPAGEQVFAHISNGNDPLSWSPANGGAPILTSTVGSRAVRDMYLVSKEDQSQHYIIATDLNATREGFGNPFSSRGLVIWASEGGSLTRWGESRLVNVVPEEFRMAWAPEALWLEEEQRFMVYWSSTNYADASHAGEPEDNKIYVAYTTDFSSFSAPIVYFALAQGTGVIDMTIHPVGNGEYVRLFKNEKVMRVAAQISSGGVHGSWVYIGGSDSTWIDDEVSEGALFFKDNLSDKWYIWLDEYTQKPTGYRPFVASNGITRPGWEKLGLPGGFPKSTKHGVVTPVTQSQYDELRSVYG